MPEIEFDYGSIIVEGATDHFMGRPRDQNPFSEEYANEWWQAWDFGWTEAKYYLDERMVKETRRWLT